MAPSLGWQQAHWIETLLCHGPGDVKGEAIRLEAEFIAFLAAAYELGPSGRRLVDEALLSRAKGFAKSEKAGAMVCVEFLGPARFDHWAKRGETSWWGYEFERGEPVGRPVRDPFIRCLATEETQTGNTYDNVVTMLEHLVRHHGDEFPTLDIGMTRTLLFGGGEVRPSSASSASKDGGKETFGVADEPHLYVIEALRAMYLTVSQNLTKRPAGEPWFLLTSTMYQPGQNSIAEQVMAPALENGVVPQRVLRRFGRLLVDHRHGSLPEDWDDDEQMVECLREAFGDAAEWALPHGAERVLGKVRDTKISRARACRYYLNRPAVEKRQAVDPTSWSKLAAGAGLPPAGTAVALGFDGSESGDATALVGAEMESNRRFLVAVWERPTDVHGRLDELWRVPDTDVDGMVRWAFSEWTVARMLCDPKGWRSEISDWQAKWSDKVVVEYPCNQWSRFSRAVDRALAEIKAGDHPHNGDVTLGRHWANARLRQVNPIKPESGVILEKESPDSLLHIDAAVADVLAGEARGQALAAGWKPPPPAAAVSAPPPKTGRLEDLFRPRERLNV